MSNGYITPFFFLWGLALMMGATRWFLHSEYLLVKLLSLPMMVLTVIIGSIWAMFTLPLFVVFGLPYIIIKDHFDR